MFRVEIQRLRRIHLNWLTIFQYAFITCIILNFRSIWLYADLMSWTGRIVKLMMGLSVVAGVFCKREMQLKKVHNCLTAMGGLALYVGLWYLMDPLKSGTIITILIQLLAITAYCMLVEDSVDDTMQKFTNIVMVIALVSLFFWLFSSMLGIIKPTGYLYTTWTGDDSLKRVTSYYGIYFETQSLSFFGLTVDIFVRNSAIFTEAPMASVIFSMAFLVELLLKDKLNWKRCMILVIAVASTISTTGGTILILAVGLRYVFANTRTRGSFSMKFFLMPLILVVAFITLNFLIKQKLGTSAGYTRIDDFVVGYKAWMDSPFFGNGYGNSDSYRQYMSSFRNNLGISNSLVVILAYGGVYLALPYIVSALLGITRLVRRRMWHSIAFYLVFLYAFSITTCAFQMLSFYLFMSMPREGWRKTKINYAERNFITDISSNSLCLSLTDNPFPAAKKEY